jgi:hypothetical protein
VAVNVTASEGQSDFPIREGEVRMLHGRALRPLLRLCLMLLNLLLVLLSIP